MDQKNTIIAVVLMVALMLGTQFVLQWLNPPKDQPLALEAPAAGTSQDLPTSTGTDTAGTTTLEAPSAGLPEENFPETLVTASTALYEVTFNTRGAAVVSFRLKNHQDRGEPLEMVNTFNGGAGAAFELLFGENDRTPAEAVYSYRDISGGPFRQFEFSKTFLSKNGEKFTVKKLYSLVEGEYLLGLKITLQSETNNIPVTSGSNKAYSLVIGPQIGPKFKAINNTEELRKYYYYAANERKELEFGKGPQTYSDLFKWAGLMGKYFGIIVIPDSGSYSVTWNDKLDPNKTASHSTTMSISRGSLKSSLTEDSFTFYLGPKEESILLKYNKATENVLQFAGMRLESALDRNPFLGWLEWGMKWVMDVLLNSWIQNWGITIIMLSLILRLVLWVPTHKSYESTAAMAAVGPKLSVIQEKYKNDPAKLNAAMAELYKKEGINPLGGCLPMLIQIPIMIALWQMLSTHFDLRGAVFIPGWINDLSIPETVYNWGFPLPLLGWTDLRVMPILMVATQILSSMVTQPQSAQAAQMKMMTYALPVVFFFFFYDMPSGLVLYWTVTNVLSMAQQWIINSEIKKKKAAKA